MSGCTIANPFPPCRRHPERQRRTWSRWSSSAPPPYLEREAVTPVAQKADVRRSPIRDRSGVKGFGDDERAGSDGNGG